MRTAPLIVALGLMAACRPVDIQRRPPPSSRISFGYWERLDQEIVRLGLMPEPTGLHHAEVVAALHTVTSGVVGRISRLTEAALV